MKFLGSFLLILVLVFVYFGIGRAIVCQPTRGPDKIAYTITVSLSGRSNFTRVQDAINAIPSRNTQWIRILVKPGIYREQVKIPHDKSCIFLKGRNMRTTSIEWDAHGMTNISATFTTQAQNFVAKHISFKNTYNMNPIVSNEKNITWAVAAEINGDKSSFYDCGFYGVQDTLWDVSGRHYFESCYIEGAVDFIWGGGQSIYKKCNIMFRGEKLAGPGYITAQARASEQDPSGFIFTEGTVSGIGSTWLGRAYGSHSRVIFDGTFFNDIVKPQGWWPWDHVGHEVNLTYAEVDCHGPGSDTSKRVTWEKKLSPWEVQQFTNLSYIDSPEGWLFNQPL